MPVANNGLFSIDKLAHENGVIRVTLGINSNSEIFKGHFPGQPVVPGACMFQVVKDALEIALEHFVRLKKADYLKFINMINPESTQSVRLDISYKLVDKQTISVSAKLINDEVVCFKFQGTFIK